LDDIVELRTIKCHNDCITSISILEKEKAFATSSFDCCVHIWSLTNYQKLGSLVLSQQNSLWNLKIDKQPKEDLKISYAKEVLNKIYPCYEMDK
jgi:hypothetical protein